MGDGEAAARLMAAVEAVCAKGIMTPDVGGTANTREVTQAVIRAKTAALFAAAAEVGPIVANRLALLRCWL